MNPVRMPALMLVVAVLAAGCDPQPMVLPEPAAPVDRSAFDADGILGMREVKDSLFQTADSPIPDARRGEFQGLNYYRPDHRFAFDLRLARYPEPETVMLGTSSGEIRRMLRYGAFVVLLDNQACTLTVFKSDAASSGLFIPFQDATSGSETYEVGRYLDLEEQPGDELHRLDFNQAYNPWCAYSDAFICPLVPPENRLPVPVRAGERLDAVQAAN